MSGEGLTFEPMLADAPQLALQVIESALRGILAEADDHALTSADVRRMVDPLHAFVVDTRIGAERANETAARRRREGGA